MEKKNKSILQKGKYCFICGSEHDLELHHVYFGTGLRKISDKNGFVMYLCRDHHKGDESPHMKRGIDLQFKRMCQSRYEQKHTREEFMQLIGRNYLE